MNTTNDFLDALKAKKGLPSDYALAKFTGISKQAISGYRAGKSHFDDQTAIKVAALLEIDPAFVVMCAHRERAKTAEEKAVWSSVLEKLGGLAAALMLVPVLLMIPSESHAMSAAYNSQIQELTVFRS